MMLGQLQQGTVLLRLALCSLAALFLWFFTQGWNPPFSWREGDIPQRDVVARVDLSNSMRLPRRKSATAHEPWRSPSIYQDPEPLAQLRAELVSEVGKLLSVKSF